MNLSYNWLKELVPFELSPEELAKELTRVGCCVEEIEQIGDDWQLVAEVTTNRPDWLCHWGIAHEIAAFTSLKLKLPEITLPKSGDEKITDITSVINEVEDLCPRYTARVIKGVKVGPSPDWLQNRLRSVGLKPRNNIVDITNLVLFETNQPLHAFDFDLLKENRIIIRHAKDKEKFTSVFDEERELNASMCVIADAEKAVALAGVKGGKECGVSDNSVNILLESAYFAQTSTRKSSQATLLNSDSSYRFERGIDPGGVANSSARAVQLICELAGGTLVDGIIDTNPELATPWEVAMRFTRCTKILGTRVEPRVIEKIFIGLGLNSIEKNPSKIIVQVPTFRQDITREADLIEEVARCYGYENIPTKIEMPQKMVHLKPDTIAKRKAIDVLTALGYNETMTDTFVEKKWVKEFDSIAEYFSGEYVKINNPVREDRPFMRVTLVPSLLEVRRINRGSKQERFFEINRTYIQKNKDEILEPTNLCLIDDRGIEFVKGAFETLLKKLRIPGICTFTPINEERKGFADTTVTEIRIEEKVIGLCGNISAKAINTHDLLEKTSVLEVNFDELANRGEVEFKFKALPKFPGIVRDISLVVNENTKWSEIESTIMEKPEFIEKVEFASCYRGKQIPNGMKSMAFSIYYRNPEKSFRDEEANSLRDIMVSHLTGKFEGSTIRK